MALVVAFSKISQKQIVILKFQYMPNIFCEHYYSTSFPFVPKHMQNTFLRAAEANKYELLITAPFFI